MKSMTLAMAVYDRDEIYKTWNIQVDGNQTYWYTKKEAVKFVMERALWLLKLKFEM